MKRPPLVLILCAVFACSACVNTPVPPDQAETLAAAAYLKQAGAKATPAEQRAALYLQAAAEAGTQLGSRSSGTSARIIYNQAATDLTVLLRGAEQGRLWNRPLTLTSGSITYRLNFAKASRDGVWDPDQFASVTAAAVVPMKAIHRSDRQEGVGGALVGVHMTQPLAAFSPKVGVTAAVTALLDFKGHAATLTLMDPTAQPKARVAGAESLLNADFSAPLAYYPDRSEYWNGIMGALHVKSYMGTTGLYELQPYDAQRIPVIFVHGLISTALMWRNVINELEFDPALRQHYQFLVFGYPTGNPPAYSALRLRQELARFYQIHPDARRCVLVGHSMGGILSRMQVVTLDRDAWNAMGRDKAAKFFGFMTKGSVVEEATVFKADPHVGRVVFICTPHRGSAMALSRLGELARRLIFLPAELTSSITGSLGNAVAMITGDPKRMPTSVDGLAPSNPMLKVLDARPIQVPYHSIIGDRGKGDTPNSSDGVVDYWSSHLNGARSECIVPGPHGSCELPQTLTEVRRILTLHLQESGHQTGRAAQR
ncbi:MAG: alpha/beta fold hydrolase [Verrucomicrobiota bacterium]